MGPPSNLAGRGISNPVDVADLLGDKGGGSGGAATSGYVNIGKYNPTTRQQYLDMFGQHPEQNVPGLNDSAGRAAQYSNSTASTSPYKAEQAQRRTELDQTKKENRDMALMQAGLAIMGTKSPTFLGGAR
jgi:hypothetical protein